MNIKQASEVSGVSSRNIRYYEQAGLICPARDPGNGYRIYSEELVRTLKLIRILRMLDMPVEEIRGVLRGHFRWPGQRKNRRNASANKSVNWRLPGSSARNCSSIRKVPPPSTQTPAFGACRKHPPPTGTGTGSTTTVLSAGPNIGVSLPLRRTLL